MLMVNGQLLSGYNFAITITMTMTIYIAPKSKSSKALYKTEKIQYKNKGAKSIDKNCSTMSKLTGNYLNVRLKGNAFNLFFKKTMANLSKQFRYFLCSARHRKQMNPWSSGVSLRFLASLVNIVYVLNHCGAAVVCSRAVLLLLLLLLLLLNNENRIVWLLMKVFHQWISMVLFHPVQDSVVYMFSLISIL